MLCGHVYHTREFCQIFHLCKAKSESLLFIRYVVVCMYRIRKVKDYVCLCCLISSCGNELGKPREATAFYSALQ